MKPDLRRQDCYGVFIMSNPLIQSCLLRRPFTKELRNIGKGGTDSLEKAVVAVLRSSALKMGNTATKGGSLTSMG